MLEENFLKELYEKWENKQSLQKDITWINKNCKKNEIAQIYKYFQEKYYTEFPLYIPQFKTDHYNGLEKIGQHDYKTYNTFIHILKKGSGKTYLFIVWWCYWRFINYGEQFALLRRRDKELKELIQDIKGGGPIFENFELKGRIIYEKHSHKRMGRIDALTSMSGGINSVSHTNIFYDEFIPLKKDPITNEKRLLNNYLSNTYRDNRFIGRLIMAANSHTINITYLNNLNIDFDKFSPSNPIYKIKDNTKALWFYIGIKVKVNVFNTYTAFTPLANFSDEAEESFLNDGTFSFDNRSNYWNPAHFVIFELNSAYIFKGITFYQGIAYNLKTEEKKVIFLNKNHVKKLNVWELPHYALHSHDIAENEGVKIYSNIPELSYRWMRAIIKSDAKFASFELKELIKEFFISAQMYNFKLDNL